MTNKIKPLTKDQRKALNDMLYTIKWHARKNFVAPKKSAAVVRAEAVVEEYNRRANEARQAHNEKVDAEIDQFKMDLVFGGEAKDILEAIRKLAKKYAVDLSGL